MARMIDIEAINWYDDLFMKGENHNGVWVRYRDVEKLIRNAPIVDAVPVDKAISAIQEMIESIDEDFPLLDFNSRYMMERGMRMSLIQIKKLRTNGERKGGDE